MKFILNVYFVLYSAGISIWKNYTWSAPIQIDISYGMAVNIKLSNTFLKFDGF